MNWRKNFTALLLCCALLLAGVTAQAEDSAPTVDEFLGTWKLDFVVTFDADYQVNGIYYAEENGLPEQSFVIEPDRVVLIQEGVDDVVGNDFELGVNEGDGSHFLTAKYDDGTAVALNLAEMEEGTYLHMILDMDDAAPYSFYYKRIEGAGDAVTSDAAEAEASDAEEASDPGAVHTDKDTVQKVQQALNDAGYNCGTPDGIAGKNTAAAISQYQTDNGLTATGTVTDELLTALGLL